MYDKDMKEVFRPSSETKFDPRWWQGEPVSLMGFTDIVCRLHCKISQFSCMTAIKLTRLNRCKLCLQLAFICPSLSFHYAFDTSVLYRLQMREG